MNQTTKANRKTFMIILPSIFYMQWTDGFLIFSQSVTGIL